MFERKCADLIKELVIQYDLDAVTLARELRIHYTTVRKYMEGDSCPPIETWLKLTRILPISIDIKVGKLIVRRLDNGNVVGEI